MHSAGMMGVPTWAVFAFVATCLPRGLVWVGAESPENFGGVYSPSLASGDSGLQPDAQASSCKPLPPSQPRKAAGRSASKCKSSCDEINGLLREAVMSGDVPRVEKLLEQGADVEMKHDTMESPLTLAIKNGHFAVVKILVDAGADVEVHEGINGFTPLVIGAGRGHRDTICTLLKAGADVNNGTDQGVTALMKASLKGHVEIVKLLIEAGAEVDAATPIGWSPIIYAASRGHSEVMSALIAAGADVDAQERIFGWTALMKAARKGYVSAIKILLMAGASKDIKTASGATALSLAEEKGQSDAVKLLEADRVESGCVRAIPWRYMCALASGVLTMVVL